MPCGKGKGRHKSSRGNLRNIQVVYPLPLISLRAISETLWYFSRMGSKELFRKERMAHV